MGKQWQVVNGKWVFSSTLDQVSNNNKTTSDSCSDEKVQANNNVDNNNNNNDNKNNKHTTSITDNLKVSHRLPDDIKYGSLDRRLSSKSRQFQGRDRFQKASLSRTNSCNASDDVEEASQRLRRATPMSHLSKTTANRNKCALDDKKGTQTSQSPSTESTKQTGPTTKDSSTSGQSSKKTYERTRSTPELRRNGSVRSSAASKVGLKTFTFFIRSSTKS